MKTGHSLLPIAVLATCLWVADAMAQAVSTPPGASREGGPAVHADIGTHGTGERPGTGDHPATAQLAAVAVSNSAEELRQRALTAMETLREEIATLTALKHAQEALLAWNRGRTEGDEATAFLASALCAEPALGAWCPLLPATFGNPSPTAEESHDRD